MPTEIARGEHPDIIPISPGNPEAVALRWDIIMSNHDTFQVRLEMNDQDYIWTHNLNINWVMSDWTGNRRWGEFVVNGEEFDPTLYIPEMDDIKFILRVWVHANLDTCEDCDSVENFCHTEHIECASCGEIRPERSSEYINLNVDYGEEEEAHHMCEECTDNGIEWDDVIDYKECDDCTKKWSDNAYSVESHRVYGERDSRSLCEGCRESYFWCEGCEDLVYEDDVHTNDYGDYHCPDCYSSDGVEDDVYEWNYRPNLVFHPSIPVDPLKPLYIGMELEMSWRGYEAKEWIAAVHDLHGDLLYCKSDSSVEDGFEVVTHPMSPDWAAKNFPFEVFQEAIDAGATPKHSSCGTHIHIDKAALTTAQMWKILQVHMRLPDFCGIIGGRGTDASYARFDHETNEAIVGNMLKIARNKGEAFGSAARYVAVNVQNEQTIELRYMEGSIEPDDIKKNIQWAQALYDFTDTISVQDVKAGVINIPNYLLHFIMDGEYPDLLDHLHQEMAVPLALPGRSN